MAQRLIPLAPLAPMSFEVICRHIGSIGLDSFFGVIVAVAVARVLRGPAKAQEAQAAMGTPLDAGT